MRSAAPRPNARALRRLLLTLPLMLTVAAHVAVSAGIGRQRATDGTAPQTWFNFRRYGADRSDNYHRYPSTKNEESSGSRRRRRSDEGKVTEAHQEEDCKSRSAGEDQLPCEPQPSESAGDHSSWLRHYIRAARRFRRRRDKSGASNVKGEDVCLKEEMRNSIFHHRTRSSFNQREIQGEISDLLDEGFVNMDEISKRFCSSGSIMILSATLKTHSTDLTATLQLKMHCAPALWRTDFIGNRESSDGSKCYSWGANRNFISFMDIIRTYVSNTRRGNGPYCFPSDNKNTFSGLEESHGKVSKSNTTKSLPKVIKGIKCRYDLVEGAVNDIGQVRAGCKRNCTKIAGRIVCFCPGGFVKGRSKAAEDEEDPSGVVRHCKELAPGAEKCPQGYYLDTDTRVCIDIDECLQNKGGCAHECENTNGGFKCTCRPGFFLMEDQKTCDDRDECAIGENGRSFSGCAYKCTNLPNGFMCSCPEGFVSSRQDPTACVNLKENITLTLEGVFYSKPTVPATDGKCPKGFLLDANNVTCTDIDECRQNISGCGQVCQNLYGGYKCKCRAGYTLMKDHKSCKDFNECHYQFISRCQDKCVNTKGSYRCTCRSGFALKEDQKSCEDIDECRDNTAGCTQQCENTAGSFKCSCSRGFYLLDDDKTCQDIDECRLNISGCAQECENTAGSFRCKCRPGYALLDDRKTCGDIDECRRNISGCAHQCENTVGSYQCKCRPGYFLMEDGRSCDDRDECAVDRTGRIYAPCSHECINLPSGFMCSCPEGFVINAHIPGLCVEEEGHHAVTPQSRVEGTDLS